MANIDVVRMQLMQAVVDVVEKLDDRGIPVLIPDQPPIVECIIGLPMGRIFIENKEAAEAAGGESGR